MAETFVLAGFGFSSRRRGGSLARTGHHLGHLAAANAGGAGADAFAHAIYHGSHRAQVHVPAPFGHIVSVADIVAELRPFAADIAYSWHRNSKTLDSGSVAQACFRRE